MFNYVEAKYELQKRLDIINDYHNGKITEKEAIDKINQMVNEYNTRGR